MKMLPGDYSELRLVDPYANPHHARVANPHFYTDTQARIYHDIYLARKTKVVEQHTLNMTHLRKHAYFAEAMQICEEFGLQPLMEFNYKYDDYLITQFYATIHFGDDEDRRVTWMTRDVVLSASWCEFGRLLGYDIPELCEEDASGWRCHEEDFPSKKDVLAPLYIPGYCKPGFSAGLLPVYDIMHRIYRQTIAVRVGNVDEIHGYVIDLIL
jgi:hypothetical protein